MSTVTDLPDRFVKLDEAERRVGFGKSMIYRLIQQGEFPPPYKLSLLTSRWSDRDIIAWIDEQSGELSAGIPCGCDGR